ncbi:MAG: hypothetical protein PHU31_11470 [Anaerotignum sp.]|nr:hypothetical protein [Anaerotignum sp.]
MQCPFLLVQSNIIRLYFYDAEIEMGDGMKTYRTSEVARHMGICNKLLTSLHYAENTKKIIINLEKINNLFLENPTL